MSYIIHIYIIKSYLYTSQFSNNCFCIFTWYYKWFCVWQERIETIRSNGNIGARISIYLSPDDVLLSFWHNKNLNTNNNEQNNNDDRSLKPAFLNCTAWKCRMNTITVKYVLSPSAINSGANTDDQDIVTAPSSFRTTNTENTSKVTRWIQSSKTVIPNQHISSRNVRNIVPSFIILLSNFVTCANIPSNFISFKPQYC